jgi:hypothetical protein
MSALERVTERVNRLGDPDEPSTPRPLLTIDEFFEGNSEIGSIGCNLTPTPTPDEFATLLRSIATRSDVFDVRVQVTMFDTPEWPFSDTVYIMTSASPDDVLAWFPERLRPDETWLGFTDQPFEPYVVPAGARPVGVWWD